MGYPLPSRTTWAGLSETQLTSDPEGTDYTDTTYDAVGRTSTVSNPYRKVCQPNCADKWSHYYPIRRAESSRRSDPHRWHSISQ